MRPSQSTTKMLSSIISRSVPRATTSSSTRALATTRPLTSLSSPRSHPRHLPFNTTYQTIRTYTSKNHEHIDTRPLTDRRANPPVDAQHAEQNRLRREQEPAYKIVFTCKPCGHRSAHRMSKQGYHRGTVVIKCPSCANRHVMSDHLKIFFDKSSTLDEILGDRGHKVTKGYLEGDFEFWEDGTVTQSESAAVEKGDEAGQEKKKSDAQGEDEPRKLS